jgi:ABC-type Fe3+ transport system substrate-binding protein
MGPEFLTRLFTEMDVTIAGDARQAAEQMALGTYAFCLYACQQEVATAMEQGLPVKDQVEHLLEEGPTLSVGAGAIYAVDTPANPNAQKLFINWFLSKEGQALMQKANGEDSARVDIPKDAVRDSLRRQEGVEYVFNEVQPDFVEKQAEAIEFMRQLLASQGY